MSGLGRLFAIVGAIVFLQFNATEAIAAYQIELAVGQTAHGNIEVLRDLNSADAAQLSTLQTVSCSLGCFRKLRLRPLPGGVDFCYIHDRNIGKCMEVPDCEYTCR